MEGDLFLDVDRFVIAFRKMGERFSCFKSRKFLLFMYSNICIPKIQLLENINKWLSLETKIILELLKVMRMVVVYKDSIITYHFKSNHLKIC